MVIDGYGNWPLAEADSLVVQPGFWAAYLLGLYVQAPADERPEPECFGGDGADADAMAEVLMDPQSWPTFRVPFGGGAMVYVVFRNLEGDYGVDYLRALEGQKVPRDLASFEGEWCGPGLTWQELIRTVDTPEPQASGVHDEASRLLLLLPTLMDHPPTEDALARISAALISVGAPPGTADETASSLLQRFESGPLHDPAWRSPLSGSEF